MCVLSTWTLLFLLKIIKTSRFSRADAASQRFESRTEEVLWIPDHTKLKKMYWELWLSQLAASDALQSMLVQNKGRLAFFVVVVQLSTMWNEHGAFS